MDGEQRSGRRRLQAHTAGSALGQLTFRCCPSRRGSAGSRCRCWAPTCCSRGRLRPQTRPPTAAASCKEQGRERVGTVMLLFALHVHGVSRTQETAGQGVWVQVMQGCGRAAGGGRQARPAARAHSESGVAAAAGGPLSCAWLAMPPKRPSRRASVLAGGDMAEMRPLRAVCSCCSVLADPARVECGCWVECTPWHGAQRATRWLPESWASSAQLGWSWGSQGMRLGCEFGGRQALCTAGRRAGFPPGRPRAAASSPSSMRGIGCFCLHTPPARPPAAVVAGYTATKLWKKSGSAASVVGWGVLFRGVRGSGGARAWDAANRGRVGRAWKAENWQGGLGWVQGSSWQQGAACRSGPGRHKGGTAEEGERWNTAPPGRRATNNDASVKADGVQGKEGSARI